MCKCFSELGSVRRAQPLWSSVCLWLLVTPPFLPESRALGFWLQQWKGAILHLLHFYHPNFLLWLFKPSSCYFCDIIKVLAHVYKKSHSHYIHRLEENPMPRLFGYGPERETFEHLAHKARFKFVKTFCFLYLAKFSYRCLCFSMQFKFPLKFVFSNLWLFSPVLGR